MSSHFVSNPKTSTMSRLFLAASLTIATVLTAGCATITRGTTEALVIETEPPGATANISPEGRVCKTPCTLELKRKRDYVVDIERPGYEPVRVNVISEIAGAGAAGMAGNVLLGGIIGAGVDVATGATKRLTPNPVKVNLVKLVETTAPPAAPTPAAAPGATAPVSPAVSGSTGAQ
jgi:hypothetical protein